MRERRHAPPNAQRVAARFNLEPASDEAGKRAYLVARELGTANDLRSWDREEYKDGDWECVSIGLPEREKLCWRLIAAAAGAA